MSSTTYVTAFFDIPKHESNTSRRQTTKYLQDCQRFLQKSINLIFFGEPEFCEYVLSERQKYKLESMTQVYPMSMTELPYYERIPEMKSIYDEKGVMNYREDKRLTPHYLICIWAKVYLALQASIKNPFDTTHFCWFDFGYYHMADEYPHEFNKITLFHFQELDEYWTDRFRLVSISHPLPKELYDNPVEYHSRDRYQVAGGVFGGNQTALSKFYQKIQEEIELFFQLRILAAEENIYGRILYRYPELCDLTTAYYSTLFLNFSYIHDSIEKVLYQVGAYGSRGYHTLEIDLCTKVIEGLNNGVFELNINQLQHIYHHLLTSSLCINHELYKKYRNQCIEYFKNKNLILPEHLQTLLQY